MGASASALLSRAALFAVLGLLATATLTFAASKKIGAATATPATVSAPAAAPLVVPDVRGEAYVFAKGILEDAGFAWHVTSKNGYAANTVVSQSPAPGTKVVDNGAPTMLLTLSKNPHYPQKGSPENDAPFSGTSLLFAASARAAKTEASAPPAAKPAARPAAKPAATPAAKAKPAAKRAAKPAAKPAAKRTAKPAAKAKPSSRKTPASRPPDFVVRGAPKEPLDEMPLTDRARRLGSWLEQHRQPTRANMHHWRYQHAWVVTGAKFGWWHGAQALRILIQDDRRAGKLWGIGTRSEATARQALAEVEASAK